MARFIHREQSEITMDYVNLPDASARTDTQQGGGGTPAVSGRKLLKVVAVSFGLLCILQAALNISLRLDLFKARCTNLTEEADGLRRELIPFDRYFQQGWVYLRPSFYYISSTKKSWQESRDDCLKRDADLVVINSNEEQDFTRKFHKLTWIGLLEGETNGTWKWVDGTPLTKSYWGPGEPNGFEGKTEDCVEIRFHEMENSWNDIPCGDQNFWICEKMIAL
ncbi:CD209 antigen-like protein E [Anoplopoma fimbria]|uniref:CD209 antigen-like protein E n=1 Tax=Anoplopoma fimbria TaxID=229290 RepID=UPI0023ECA666|nr:CD209 antigen-like protein E [Anoplopoma fimbria]